MAWSTRELAELAGTTLNAVRHYHRVGLLDEPERTSNGYKQYEVRHLVRLMHIRRLRDLGVPLDQIKKATTHGTTSAAALSAIDAEIEKDIERLQRARTEIAAILRGSANTDASAVTGHTAAAPFPAPTPIDRDPTWANNSHINYPGQDAAHS